MSSNLQDRLPARTASACTTRRLRLLEALKPEPVDGLLVSHPRDIRYLTGFVGDDSLLIVLPGTSIVVSDPRYEEFLEPWAASGLEVVMGTRHRLHESVAALCRTRRIRRVGLQAEHLTIAGLGRLSAALPDVALSNTMGLVARLRMRKDDLELAAIERAGRIQAEALHAALRSLTVGMTEIAFCAALEYEMKVRGSAAPSFPTMVAAGPRSSIIHHQTGDAPITEGTLLVDWGAVVDGYCSDMTRTFGVGRLPPKIRQAYQVVLEAQLAAIGAAAPGRTCAEIDAVARNIIEAAGHGSHFGHGLGHGLGLDIHEEPFFNQLSTETVLEPGMVMTVEPGIYIPSTGGVRLEDDIVITQRGCRVLTDFPKGLDPAVLEPALAAARG